MTSGPIRDPIADHLITPHNAALLLIDYQPSQAHRAGVDRVVQAGGQPITWVSLACELQRDWARTDTIADIIEIVLTDRLRKE